MTPSSTTALRRPVRQHVHLPQLDGLRTLAVVLVLGYHVVRTEEIPVLSGAFIGVDVFFVLSGFLITTLLLREHASSGRIDLRRFYVRRLWRLYPALVLVSVVAAAAFTVRPSLFGLDAGSPVESLVALAYGMSWWSGLELTGGPYLLGLTWSLSVEEHFYLLWPLLLIALLRRGAGLRSVVLVAVLANAWPAVLWLTGADPDRLYYLPDSRFAQLLTGCALAAMLVARDDAGRLTGGLARWAPAFSGPAAALALAGTAVVVVVGDRYAAWYWVGGMQAVGVASAVVIGHLVLHGEGRLAAQLGRPWAAQIGVWSYGIYLWHLPLIRLARPVLGETLLVTVAAALLAVPVAAASYAWVEQPLLRSRARPTPTPVPLSSRRTVPVSSLPRAPELELARRAA